MKKLLLVAVICIFGLSFKTNEGYPCHPAGDLGPCTHPVHPRGDLGPCTHYNYYGYRIHQADVYQCSHPVHANDIYPCGHICY